MKASFFSLPTTESWLSFKVIMPSIQQNFLFGCISQPNCKKRAVRVFLKFDMTFVFRCAHNLKKNKGLMTSSMLKSHCEMLCFFCRRITYMCVIIFISAFSFFVIDTVSMWFWIIMSIVWFVSWMHCMIYVLLPKEIPSNWIQECHKHAENLKSTQNCLYYFDVVR